MTERKSQASGKPVTKLGYETIELPSGAGARGIVLNSDATRAFVCNFGLNNVSVIDTKAKRVIANVPVGANPYYAAFDSKRNYCYMTCLNTPSTVFVLNERTVVREIVTTGPRLPLKRLTVDPINRRVFVVKPFVPGLSEHAQVMIIDADTGEEIASIDIESGQLEGDVAVDPAKHRAYVPISYDRSTAIVGIIDTQTNQLVGFGPWIAGEPATTALSLDGRFLYVAGRPNTSVVDTNAGTLLRFMFSTGSNIHLSPDGDRAYFIFTDYVDGQTWSILQTADTSTGAIIGWHRIAPTASQQMAVSQDGKTAYITTGPDVIVADIASYSPPTI